MYQVFNPIQGQYTQATSLDDAKILFNEIQQEYCAFQNIGQYYSDESFYKANQLVANEFIAVKEGIPSTDYDYCIYNATTKEYTNQVFVAKDVDTSFLVKVLDGAVTEWYQENGVINEVQHSYISLDLETGNPIEYYDIVGNVMSKYSLDGTFIVSTYFGDCSSISKENQLLLDGFQYNNGIFAWSDKSYGFIVEYKRYDLIPYADCNDEQKSELDQQKVNFIAQNRELFVVNQEITNPDESITWTIVDTSDW